MRYEITELEQIFNKIKSHLKELDESIRLVEERIKALEDSNSVSNV